MQTLLASFFCVTLFSALLYIFLVIGVDFAYFTHAIALSNEKLVHTANLKFTVIKVSLLA